MVLKRVALRSDLRSLLRGGALQRPGHLLHDQTHFQDGYPARSLNWPEPGNNRLSRPDDGLCCRLRT